MARQRHTPHAAAMTDLAEAYAQLEEVDAACHLIAEACTAAPGEADRS